jgi:uncharacterized protein (UPF0147 family)
MAMTYSHDLLEIASSFNNIYTILKAICQDSYVYHNCRTVVFLHESYIIT